MIIKDIQIEQFRAFEQASFSLGKRITAISGRNATQKTTVLGMIGQPFTISSRNPIYGCKTIDGFNFRSQFKEKFKISPSHDIIGQHRWTLNLHNGIHTQNYYIVESIARKQGQREATLRFWNAESRASGAGYIQLPVYFLSLSRLFPIGESGKTKSMPPELTAEELDYCVTNYRTILSIQQTPGDVSIGIEKGTASRMFSGVSDGVHDIFTNSAGEGNITKIILAVLSFKRLKEQYPRDYKGGLLLIDELDATLYGFSQKALVDYLWTAANEFKIQIVLKQVNKYQRKERQQKGIELPLSAYDSAIVYLEPQYDAEGKRMITSKNISTTNDLNSILNDINLAVPSSGSKINVYCEDNRAIAFVEHVLFTALGINLDLYMNFVEINLGWTNYIQLYEKSVPEFCNNLIILDGDVLSKREYRSKEHIISDAGNFLFLPLTIEKSLFETLKNHEQFNRFKESSARSTPLNYDICFNEWPLEVERYNTNDFKKWFAHIETIVGNQDLLYDFWCNENQPAVNSFVEKFTVSFNILAERQEIDSLPITTTTENPVIQDEN